MERNRILLVGIEGATQTALRDAMRDAEIIAAPQPSLDLVRRAAPTLAAVSVADDAEKAFRLVATLTAAGTRVVVVGPAKDADLILRAMREGAREYLVTGDHVQLARALRDLTPRTAGAEHGRVTALLPAKGGVGATSIATNLAGSLAQRGERVCLVDLDMSMGDVLAFLDMQGGFSIPDVIANMERFDRGLLDTSVPRHRSGVFVVAQAQPTLESSSVDPASLATMIEFLRSHFQVVILDGIHTLDPHSMAALEVCDRILLVATQEVPAVRRAQRLVSLLARLGHEGERLRLVVNRHARGAEVGNGIITETIGLPIAATISSDYPALIRAVNRGQLLADVAPGSPMLKDIATLHALLGHEERVERPSLLRRIFAQKAVRHAQ